MVKPVIYLASSSPQRAFLLTRAHIPFTVVRSTCDEETITAPHPRELALERARAKARGAQLTEAHANEPNAVILGADTVVALGNDVFGKPSDQSDAERILNCLQGTTHTVYTGHCCIRIANNSEVADTASAQVTMRSMSQADIHDYLSRGESAGRAGAYAIQESGDEFVTNLVGSWDTVVGLHVAMVADLYRTCCGTWPAGYKP